MSVKSILDNANAKNIADSLDEDVLIEIGNWVCEGHEQDSATMKEWSKLIDRGLDVAKFELSSKSYPWEDAANFKSPVIFEAVRDFGDRASSEILRQKDIVAISTIVDNEEVEAIAERVSTHMNYQVNSEIKNWRKQQSKHFYTLAAMGACVKKTFFDVSTGGINSEWIKYPDFSVNNQCSDFEQASRFTHVRKISINDIYSRVATRAWLDIELTKDEDEDEEERNDYVSEFLECYCRYDIDKDGYEEPYVITVHKASSKVVRIAPRYSELDIYIQYEDRTLKALDVAKAIQQEIEQNELIENKKEVFKEDVEKAFSQSKLVRIEEEKMLTLYNFVEPIDGTLLGLGFLHVMSCQALGINLATNDLFNAGTLSNQQTGLLSREHRSRNKGPFKASPGHWEQTDITADKLLSSMLPLPIKEPSPTLFQLVERLKEETQALGTKTNIGDALSPNVPAISVLGMLQEGIISTSALISRVINAMSEEFEIIARLNAVYTDPVLYKQVTNDEQASYETDYNEQTIDIKPTANAQFSSQFQRIQLAQVQMEQVPLLLQAQANPLPVIRDFFDAIGSQVSDEVFAPPNQQDSEQLKQMQALQEQQIAVQQQQAALMQAQVELANRQQDLREQEALFKAEKETIELEQKQSKLDKEIDKMNAEIVKMLEEAETESQKNNIEELQRQFSNLLEVEKLDVQRNRTTQR